MSAPIPNVSAWGCQPVRAASAVVAAACVLAFVPVVAAAPIPKQPGWATPPPALIQPVRAVYSSIVWPVKTGTGLQWVPRLPDLVRSVPVAGEEVFAAPLTTPAPSGVNWWYPRPSDPIRPTLPVVSQIVSPFSAVIADSATAADSGGQLVPRPVIHNAPIAGPMATGSGLGWLSRVSDPVRLTLSTPSVSAAPLTVQAPAGVNWWFSRVPDPIRLVPPIVSTLAAPPVAGLPGWQSDSVDAARPSLLSVSSLASPVTTGFGAWATESIDSVRPLLGQPSILVQPASQSSSLPWVLTGQPSILPPYPTRAVFALNPTTPAAQAVTLPWLMPSGQLVFLPVARYEAVYAKPILPFTAGGSNLPWLLTGAPLVRAQYLYQSSLALNPTTPAAVVNLPWLIPPGSLVFLPVARYEAAYAKPILPFTAGRSDLPWLLTGAPLIRPLSLYQSSLALNPTTPSAAVTLPWIAQVQAGQIRPLLVLSQLAIPLQPTSAFWYPHQPPLVRLVLVNQPQTAQPMTVPLVHGWWKLPPDASRQVVLVSSRFAQPVYPQSPSGRSDLPWLPQAPRGIPPPVGAPSSMVLPPIAEILASIGLPSWIVTVPSWPDVILVDAYPDVILVERMVSGSVDGSPYIIIVPKSPDDVES